MRTGSGVRMASNPGFASSMILSKFLSPSVMSVI